MNKINWQNLGRVVVFIDAANLENSVKDLGWWVDYKKLDKFFINRTTLIEIRHFCVRFDDKGQNAFFTVLKKAGFTLITKPLKVIKEADIAKGDIRKANFDVEIALDAVEMIDKYDTLILFSGDSDFEALVKTLRDCGKKVIVFSTKHHISKELIRSCNRYIDLRKIKEEIIRRK